LFLLLNKNAKERRKDIQYFDKNISMVFCDKWKIPFKLNKETYIKQVRHLLLIGYSRLIKSELTMDTFIRTWDRYIYDHLRRICSDELYREFLISERKLQCKEEL
jgi:hypothetical protein